MKGHDRLVREKSPHGLKIAEDSLVRVLSVDEGVIHALRYVIRLEFPRARLKGLYLLEVRLWDVGEVLEHSLSGITLVLVGRLPALVRLFQRTRIDGEDGLALPAANVGLQAAAKVRPNFQVSVGAQGRAKNRLD